jgi:hypothetical protein
VPTVRDLIERATEALAALARRGEAIEDEWIYVTDLETAWSARLAEVAAARGDERAPAAVAAAVERAAAEADRIEDPHRAIDWLSTLPQVVLVALGEAA